MQRICGKRCELFTAEDLAHTAASFERVLLDVGSGDGRYAEFAARRDPALLAVGLDACREQLERRSRRAAPNCIFLIANALTSVLPEEPFASWITVNFPWGSLLAGLVAEEHDALPRRLAGWARPGAVLEVRLNAEALTVNGLTLEAAVARLTSRLACAGFAAPTIRALVSADLRACPSTWAHQLAFGRDPRAICMRMTLRPSGTLCAAGAW